MDKQAFLTALRSGLSGLPQDEIEERLTFYGEMIDDRMEEGLCEEEAVAAIGEVSEIVRQAVADTPLAKIAKERIRPKRRLKTWEIVLLALGSPIWLSLAIAAAAVLFAVIVSLWSVILSLWAVFVSLAVSAVAAVPTGAFFAVGGHGAAGLAMLSAGLVCAGLTILLFFGCMGAMKGILRLTKKITLWTKDRFIKKEDVQ